MSPAFIKAHLENKGVTQSSLALQLCVSPAAINQVIYRKRVSREIAEAICKVIDIEFAEVFPEYESLVAA